MGEWASKACSNVEGSVGMLPDCDVVPFKSGYLVEKHYKLDTTKLSL